jgi:hypothetical protein
MNESDSTVACVPALQDERDKLAHQLAALQEKLSHYAPVVREWMMRQLPPEEAEGIMRANQWVDFETVMRELSSVQEVSDVRPDADSRC